MKFSYDSICHYEVGWPNGAKRGDVIYLNIITQRNVKGFIYIGTNISAEYVTQCQNVLPAEYIVATFPNRFFLTYISESTESTAFYYVNVYY